MSLDKEDRVRFLCMLEHSLCQIQMVVEISTAEMAQKMLKNPMAGWEDPAMKNWGLLMQDLFEIDMDGLRTKVAGAIREELSRPTPRQEVIDQIYKAATKASNDKH
jgi:hypothetical protein